MMNQQLGKWRGKERKKKKKRASNLTHAHTNDLSHIATTRRYLVTALALETEPSSSDNDGSGEVFAHTHKKKKSANVNSGYNKGVLSHPYRMEVNFSA